MPYGVFQAILIYCCNILLSFNAVVSVWYSQFGGKMHFLGKDGPRSGPFPTVKGNNLLVRDQERRKIGGKESIRLIIFLGTYID